MAESSIKKSEIHNLKRNDSVKTIQMDDLTIHVSLSSLDASSTKTIYRPRGRSDAKHPINETFRSFFTQTIKWITISWQIIFNDASNINAVTIYLHYC